MRHVNDKGSFASLHFFGKQPWDGMSVQHIDTPLTTTTTVPGTEPAQHHEEVGTSSEINVEEAEPMQICNLNESVLRLEELAEKKQMTFKLSNDGVHGLRALYHELDELNSRATKRSEESRPSCFTRGQTRSSGLRSEDADLLIDEQRLSQLVYEFGLEKIHELPVLKMETITKYV